MTTKTLRIALAAALIAGASFANAHAASFTTLDTVQVRPAADQIAQQTLERSSGIRTLTAVQVRPSTEQLAALAAEQAGPLVLICSDLAGVVNGIVMPVDGGFMGGLATGQVDITKMMSAASRQPA